MKTEQEILEDIQFALCRAGARLFRQKEIKELTVEELISLLLPNDILIDIKHTRL